MSIKHLILCFAFLLQVMVNASSQDFMPVKYQYLSPVPGSMYHKRETAIIIRFDEIIDPSTVVNEHITVNGEISGNHNGRISLGNDLRTLTFQPDSIFTYNEDIEVRINEGIKTKSGLNIPGFFYRFKIEGIIDIDKEQKSQDNNIKTEGPVLNTLSFKKSGALLFNDMFFCSILINDNPSSGNILTTLDGTPGHFIYIFNNNGVPVFVRKFPTQVYNLKPQPDGLLTYYDMSISGYIVMDSLLNIVDTLTMKNGYTAHTHEALILMNGHVLLFAYDPQLVDMSKIVEGGNKYATVTGLVIQELDQDKNLVFQWRSWDHFLITDSYINLLTSAIDYVHGNSLDADTDTTIILSSRNLSEITKINRLNGNIIWRFGGKNNEYSFINDPRGFSMQHSAVKLENGNLILFDNGVGFNPLYSRGIEYILDEKNLTAELIDEFRNTPDIYTNIKGNIQRTGNGNTIVYWGHVPEISEFGPSANLVFNATFEQGLYPSYRVFKDDWQPCSFTFSSDTIDFNQVQQGYTESRFFDIINNTDKLLTITSAHNSNPDFSITEPFPFEISPLGTKSVSISFSSDKTGLVTGTFNICSETDSTLVNRQIHLVAESVISTGTADNTGSGVLLYPNPGNGIFLVKLSGTGYFRIRVQDVNGRTILEDRISDDEPFSVNLADKPDGMYLVELYKHENNFRRTLKIIKQSQ